MTHALFLFNSNQKTKPKEIITSIDIMKSELGLVGVDFRVFPVDRSEGRSTLLNSERNGHIVNGIKEEYVFNYCDIGSIGPQYVGNYKEVHSRNYQLHFHEDQEARLFLRGGGAFGIFRLPWVGICVLGAGGFLNIPAKTNHWFDFGRDEIPYLPEYDVVRFWKDSDRQPYSMLPHIDGNLDEATTGIRQFPRYPDLLRSLNGTPI